MQDPISIEKVRYEELSDVEKIFRREFGDELNVAVIQQRIQKMRQFYYLLLPLSSLSLWVKNLFNVYIIKVKGKVAGFLQISHLTTWQLHLDYIALSAVYRGRGIGTRVLQKFLTDVADKNEYEVILEVRTDNPAYHLYQRLGFCQKAQVLHYGRQLAGIRKAPQEIPIAGFRRLQAADRGQLYRLYIHSISRGLRQVVRREYRDFNPGLFIRNLDWLKNQITKNQKRQYVVEVQNTIVALMELRSYSQANFHVISVILQPQYENIREALMNKAGSILARHYKKGEISTTIYNDSAAKQQALERAGYIRTETYYLMQRLVGAAGSAVSVNKKERTKHRQTFEL